MPNHCINELVFRDVDQVQQERILAVTGAKDGGKVDFKILVPQPLNIWMGRSGAVEEVAFKRTWYGWNKENWGTKWNAYDNEPVEQDGRTLTLRFQTAWGPPYPWLAAVLNCLSLPFEHNWLSEGGAPAKSGIFKTESRFGGPEWREEESTPEVARRLHKLLWGIEEFTDEDAA